MMFTEWSVVEWNIERKRMKHKSENAETQTDADVMPVLFFFRSMFHSTTDHSVNIIQSKA